MSTTNHPPEENTGSLLSAEPRWGSRLRRRRVVIAAVAVTAGLALAIAGWSAASAASQGDSMPAVAEERIDDLNSPASGDAQGEPQAPPDNEDDTTYEQCVAAALEALGPPEEASNPGSGGSVGAPGSDQTDPEKAGESETAPEVLEVEEPHPNSPAHEWCTADCPEDELCARPREFIITRDDNVETDSIENPDPGGDPAA